MSRPRDTGRQIRQYIDDPAPKPTINGSDTPPRRHNNSWLRRMLKFIIGFVIVLVLALWPVIIPLPNLGKVQQVGNGQIMQIQATNTGDTIPVYRTTIKYTDNSGQLDSSYRLLKGDTLHVIVNIYRFLWLPARYQLGDVISYNSQLTQEQNDALAPPLRSIPLQGEDNGYFSSWERSLLIQVTTLDCAIPLAQTTVSPYNLTIQLSSNGIWTCGKGI